MYIYIYIYIYICVYPNSLCVPLCVSLDTVSISVSPPTKSMCCIAFSLLSGLVVSHLFNVKCACSSTVKLPGKAIDKPNVYRFGKRYTKIKEDLKAKDATLYRKNGVLQILTRNEKIKEAPERWQDELSRQFDVVIAFEDRVYDAILEGRGKPCVGLMRM
jgi:Ssu72-like protein